MITEDNTTRTSLPTSPLAIDCEVLEPKICTRLKTLIMDRHFEVGERIQADRLARETGVSRTPVLNTLRWLAAEHIIECIRRQGMFLAAVHTGASPPADVPALIDVICRLFSLAISAGELLVEVDINPLAVLPKGQGVRALDALVVPRA